MNAHSESEPPEPRRRASPRQPQDPERRQQILQAALRVFATKGFHRTTTKDIAREADLGEGTLYNHFENKNALLLAILQNLTEAAAPQPEPEPDTARLDPHAFLHAHLERGLRTLGSETGDAFAVILAELLTNAELRDTYARTLLAPNYALAEQTLERLTQDGHVRAQHPDLTARAIPALFLGLTVLRVLGDTTLEQHWNELPDVMTDLILHGLQQPAT